MKNAKTLLRILTRWSQWCIICQWIETSVVQIMACCPFGTKASTNSMLANCQLNALENNFKWNLNQYTQIFLQWKTFENVVWKKTWLLIEISLKFVPKDPIDLLQKSHNAPVPCPTMHHFVTEMCTFLLQNGALWDICFILCGICEMSLLTISHHWLKPYLGTMLVPSH